MADKADEKIVVKEPVVLTERELAIAHGENPDTVAPVEAAPVEAAAEKVVEPVVETPAAETPPAEAPAEPAEVKPPSWLTAEHRELAASYGLSEDDLTDFDSTAEFTRAARIIDRQNASLGQLARQQFQERQNQQSEKQNGHAAAQAVENAKTAAKLAKLDLEKLKAAGYDEEMLEFAANQNVLGDEVERLQKERDEDRAKYEQLNSQFARWQQQQEAEQQAARIASFHDAVDSIGDPRFGKSVDESGRAVQLPEQAESQRRKLYEQAETLAAGIVTRARAAGAQPAMPSMAVLIRRAHQLAFADDIRAEERKKVQQEITEQSKRRRPVAQVRQPVGQVAKRDAPLSVNEQVQEVANHPEVVAAWNKMLENAGAV